MLQSLPLGPLPLPRSVHPKCWDDLQGAGVCSLYVTDVYVRSSPLAVQRVRLSHMRLNPLGDCLWCLSIFSAHTFKSFDWIFFYYSPSSSYLILKTRISSSSFRNFRNRISHPIDIIFWMPPPHYLSLYLSLSLSLSLSHTLSPSHSLSLSLHYSLSLSITFSLTLSLHHTLSRSLTLFFQVSTTLWKILQMTSSESSWMYLQNHSQVRAPYLN